MKMNTKYFGEIDLQKEEIIQFPTGIIGFEDSKEFVLIHFEPDDDTMLCLQSVNEPQLAFIVMNPHYIYPGYEPKIRDEESGDIEAGETTPVVLYVLAVIKDDYKDATVNLRCPIVVNIEKNLAKQVILDDDTFSMRHPVYAQKKEG